MKFAQSVFAAFLVLLVVSSSTVEARNPPRDPRPGQPPDVGPIGSELLAQCYNSYEAYGNAVPWQQDVDFCYMRGHKFWIPEVFRGALSPLPARQPPGFREQLDEWWVCSNSYEEYQSTADECVWNGADVEVRAVIKNMADSFRTVGY